MFRCTDVLIRSEFKVGPKKRFLPQPWGVNARGSSDQIFQMAVISEYVLADAHSVCEDATVNYIVSLPQRRQN